MSYLQMPPHCMLTRSAYLSAMGHPEVVYHEHISLLPAIEDEVTPHHVPDMGNGAVRDGSAIPKLGVKAHAIPTQHTQEEETQQPCDNRVEKVFESAKPSPDVEIFLVHHTPMKHLQDGGIHLFYARETMPTR